RPGYSNDWSEKSYYAQLRVEPLQSTSAEELLSTLLGKNPDLIPLKRLLIERTEGNPFFLEESVRSLVETGVLSGEKGAYRLVRQPAAPPVPVTVHAVLAARIDRLPAEDKRVLQAASVMGKDIPLPLLKAIVEIPLDELTRI